MSRGAIALERKGSGAVSLPRLEELLDFGRTQAQSVARGTAQAGRVVTLLDERNRLAGMRFDQLNLHQIERLDRLERQLFCN